MDNIVRLNGVSIHYRLRKYDIRAATNVSLDLVRGKITALVGESGSGKTTLASSLIRCIAQPGKLVGGEILFYPAEGGEIRVDLMKDRELQKFRWSKISMVFQAAQSALNPVMTVRSQLYETLEQHGSPLGKEGKDLRCRELLEYVQLDPDMVLDAYPHELSGGMKQRVMIAFSLLLDPELVILDEPTTALDVITQDYIFNLLRRINAERGISMLLLTHDISVVAKFADYLGVMYGGRLMEYGSVPQIFAYKSHPYSEGLIAATPSIVGDIGRMRPIEGSPPDLLDLPPGCVFSPRCPHATERCREEEPEMRLSRAKTMCKCFYA